MTAPDSEPHQAEWSPFTSTKPSRSETARVVGWTCIGTGAAAAAFGLWTIYRVETIINADAYNYTIAGLRGLAWVVLGSGLGLLGGVSLVAALIREWGRP